MKWIYRFITIAIIIGAFALPFFTSDQDGKPMLSVPEPRDFLSSVLKTAPTEPVLPSSTQTFYKWKDEQGTWHYGDTPPTNGPTFSVVQVDGNTNIIQSIPTNTTTPVNEPSSSSSITSPKASSESVLSLDNAANVLNDAKNVQNLIDNHQAQLEAIDNKN